ncbi:hypothetical protein J2T13_001075 [Paenibacillus sp. DS2015]|uniref:YheC/YheD family endospore coat-associated protein n=1 Tax=Paenibacillus sp. DS2015 TaxID=3373917 RepID=UPI003D1DBC75
MTPTIIGTLGIYCCGKLGDPPFTEEQFCRNLSLAGGKYGIQVVVFSPEGVLDDQSTIHGYKYEQGRWIKAQFPWPDMVYDRFHYHKGSPKDAASKVLASASRRKSCTMWARGLPGKYKVYNVLKQDPNIHPYLPPTFPYSGPRSLEKYLLHYEGQVFMKPQAGSQGKSTLHIRLDNRQTELLIIHGRDRHNKSFLRKFIKRRDGFEWIQHFIKQTPFIIQPYLHLYNKQQHPFDVRVLMQKEAHGNWMLTGMAAREGNTGEITSNLHGGGAATSVLPFLIQEFGDAQAEQMVAVLHKLSRDIPPILENYYGRLGELGIDFGIDREGNTWLLEVNSKPGRTSFNHIGDPRSAVLAAENPLRYARYLLLRQLRRVNS